METNQLTEAANFTISANQLFDHWQGHRRLTRKMIEAFPDDKLFNYSIGGMRPFSELVMEMVDLAEGGIQGLATGKWQSMEELSHVKGNLPKSKEELLKTWDRVTELLDELWPKLSPERFQQVELVFGRYEGRVYSHILYFIDNEIHHRGQGYVYLRSLGITPPFFWER
jgi:uncharacterized damage-inducible protein DinB